MIVLTAVFVWIVQGKLALIPTPGFSDIDHNDDCEDVGGDRGDCFEDFLHFGVVCLLGLWWVRLGGLVVF